ncbi:MULTISPECIES: alpha/beta hydrolase [Methylobacterium]|uniref:Epoxide hydrolase A n=3 Tax=Pseudomonadota TaxID=1224 RepID=A0ABQ4SZ73_9HYPH|nr:MULTISPECIES: alpha/beta hydrolase [Methylobacterium]PIU08746.1 MAG: epoxide hydrolase [Methylobacterium sp. CG09_land_8_20_14_0_10_71_15]PIU16358.1 MAG: epoxide hydrolase [Methylobacterium sp. CG08_land_8_20_14_0_20_71_15]GBU16045.1 alpha/beta hydrolase [Methylobacterium sp.]GJE07233.1 Epoxide hydrolase A [Methylobacterium jeotgali]
MAVRTGTIEANGLAFAVDEAGAGPDVALCLHGFPESRYSWRHQLPMLADLGWRAVAPDMRGYGGSARPSEQAAYRMEHLIADAAGLFDALGARRRLLIGHDWGALVAWSFAMAGARPLDGLVAMNVPHPAVFRAVLGRSWRQRARSWYVAFFQIPRLPEWALTRNRAEAVARAFTGMACDPSAFPPEVLDRYRADALRPGAMTAMLNYYRANFGLLRRPAPSPVIETPTLLVWGERDTALGLELTEGYEGLVRDFTLRRLPDVSHWVQQEAPEAVNAALAAWMRSRGLT